MATLAEIRKSYPQYDDMSDAQLSDALYKKHYSDMPRAEFDAKLGAAPAAAPTAPVKDAPAAPAPKPKAKPVQYSQSKDWRNDLELGPGVAWDQPAEKPKAKAAPKAKPVTVADIKRTVGKPEAENGRLGVIARRSGEATVPTAGGLAGAWAGGSSAAALASPLLLTPAAPLVPFIGAGGALLGGFAGAKATKMAQDAVVPENVKRKMGWDEESERRDYAAHPLTAALAEGIPGLMGGRPTKNIATTLGGGALGLTFEGASQAFSGTGMDMDRLLAAGVTGALTAKGYGASDFALGKRESTLERTVREHTPRKKNAMERELAIANMEDRAKALRAGRKDGIADIAVVPADILPDGALSHASGKATSNSDNAKDIFAAREAQVRGDGPQSTQAAAQRAAERLPGKTQTPKEIADAAEANVVTAEQALRPGVVRGDASAKVAKRVADDKERAFEQGNALFADARRGGDAAIQRVGEQGGDQFRRVTPEESVEYKVPENAWIDPATSEVMLSADYFRRFKNDGSAWEALKPEEAEGLGIKGEAYRHPKTGDIRVVGGRQDMPDGKTSYEPLGPRNTPELHAELRDAIAEFRSVQRLTPDTEATLAKFESLKDPTIRDLYDLREALNSVRQHGADKDPIAARRLINRIEEVTRNYQASGRLTGDPTVVPRWERAIGNWHDIKQRFQSGDILEELSTPQYDSQGNKVTVIDPEAARKVIFGTAKDTNAVVKNMKTIRDYLGEGSPEWDAIRQDALEHWAGPSDGKPGSETARREKLARENPAMARILLGEADVAALETARGAVDAADATKGALGAGDTFLTTSLKDFDNAVSALDEAGLANARTALRARIREMFKDPAGSAAQLDKLARGADAKANIERLLGPEETAALVSKADALVTRDIRAGMMKNPPGSAQQGSSADLARTGANLVTGHPAYAAAPAARWLEKRGLTRARAEEMARDLVDPLKTDAMIAKVKELYGDTALQRFLRDARANTANAPRAGLMSAIKAGGADRPERPEEPELVVPTHPGFDEDVDTSGKDLMSFFGVKDDGGDPDSAPADRRSTKAYTGDAKASTDETVLRRTQGWSDDQFLIATAIAEAAGESDQGLADVMSTIMNRMDDKQADARTIATAHRQFSPWNAEKKMGGNRTRLFNVTPGSKDFERGVRVLNELRSGQLERHKYRNFLNVGMTVSTQGKTPKWYDSKNGEQRGNHWFQ